MINFIDFIDFIGGGNVQDFPTWTSSNPLGRLIARIFYICPAVPSLHLAVKIKRDLCSVS